MVQRPLSFSQATAAGTSGHVWVPIWRNGAYTVDPTLGAVQELAQKSGRIWIRKVGDHEYGVKSKYAAWPIISMRAGRAPSCPTAAYRKLVEAKLTEAEMWIQSLQGCLNPSSLGVLDSASNQGGLIDSTTITGHYYAGVQQWPGYEVSEAFGKEKEKAISFIHEQIEWWSDRRNQLSRNASKANVAEAWEGPPGVLQHLWNNGVQAQPFVTWEALGGDGLQGAPESEDDEESAWCQLPWSINAGMDDRAVTKALPVALRDDPFYQNESRILPDPWSAMSTGDAEASIGFPVSGERNVVTRYGGQGGKWCWSRFFTYKYDFESRTQTRLKIASRRQHPRFTSENKDIAYLNRRFPDHKEMIEGFQKAGEDDISNGSINPPKDRHGISDDCFDIRFGYPKWRPVTVRPIRPVIDHMLYHAPSNGNGLYLGQGICTFDSSKAAPLPFSPEQDQIEMLLEYFPEQDALAELEVLRLSL